jgi:hypothetical protein
MAINKSIEISDVLTEEGIAILKVGQVLMFKKKDNRVDLKITKLDRKHGRAWARVIATFDVEDVNITSRGMFGRMKHKPVKDQIKK